VGGGGSSADPKAGDKRKKAIAADTPGAKAAYAQYLDGGKRLFLAARVYDLEAICKQHKLKIEDHCWLVLLSSKPARGSGPRTLS
jgi:hypothetical protein